MKRSWIAVAAVLASTLPLVALVHARAAAEGDTVSLDRATHFVNVEDEVVRLPAGSYRVDFAGQRVGLTAADGSRTVVGAHWGMHTAIVEEPLVLAIPGDAEQADVGFVAVLLPGGSMLEIAGTYSGVMRRGAFDKLKNSKVGQAAQQAGAKVGAAASNLKENVQEKAGNVKENVAGTVGNVKEKIGEFVNSAELQELARGIQELGLVPLLQCVATPGASNDPALGQYLDLVKSQGPQGFFRSVSQDIAGQLEKDFQVVLAQDLARLRKGEPIPSVEQIVDETFTKIEMLSKDHHAAKCLYDHMKPQLPAIKSAVVALSAEAQTKLRATFEQKVGPTMFQGLSDKLTAVLDPAWSAAAGPMVQVQAFGKGVKETKSLGEWEDKAVASGFYAQSLTEQLEQATEQLKAALAKNDPAAAKAALDSVEAWSNQAALKYGFAVIRFRGHMALEKGPPSKVIDKATSLLEVSKDLSSEIVDALCGLVPEAGGAACALLEAPLRVLWNFIGRRALMDFVEKLVHGGWEKLLQAAEAKVLDGAQASDPGPFASMVASFSREKVLAVAEKNMPATPAAMKAYNEQLRAVIAKWEK